jgi:tRNA nucleotidyltransferase (CCA-adding enzyme)
VREFFNLHADEIDTVETSMVDMERLRRLVIVDTIHCNRLGEFEGACGDPSVEVIVFDHHRLGARSQRPDFVSPENYVLSEDGSLVTTMLKIIHDRRIEVSPLEATVFALGIHEDTGSLTYPTTTPRDAEALAICMRLGASQSLIGKYLHNPLCCSNLWTSWSRPPQATSTYSSPPPGTRTMWTASAWSPTRSWTSPTARHCW